MSLTDKEIAFANEFFPDDQLATLRAQLGGTAEARAFAIGKIREAHTAALKPSLSGPELVALLDRAGRGEPLSQTERIALANTDAHRVFGFARGPR